MLEIKNSAVSLREFLGEGSFGAVFSATWESRKHHRDVAIKIIDRHTMNASAVYEEATLLSKCNHQHIVKCFGIVEDLSFHGYTGNGIVMEYMIGGDLLSYVDDCEDWFQNRRNKWFLLKIAYQIGLAMEFLENVGIVHRDVAARNILVKEVGNSEPTVKVADFGLARYQSRYDINYDSPIPFRWSAPEVLDRKTYTHKSDVWAYGVTLWEIYSFGRMPYGSITNAEVERFVNQGNRLGWPHVMPWTVRKILAKCLRYHPDDRWTFKYIVRKFETYFDRRPVSIQRFYYN